jgi:hypothetical protein
MAFDIDKMAPEERAFCLALGERYPTPNVLSQADKTLRGLALYGAILVIYGFGAEDTQDLSDARDALRAEDAGDAQTSSERKTVVQNADEAIRNGRKQRLIAITILKNARRPLRKSGNSAALAQVQGVLSQTRVLVDDSALPKQMQLLHTTLEDPAIAGVVAGRGGPDAVTKLETLLPLVRQALSDKTGHPPGTAVSERRDILDGVVVTLARSARAAARMAARDLGQPAIAAAFELTYLESARARKAPEAELPAEPTEPTAPTAPTPPTIELPPPDATDPVASK